MNATTKPPGRGGREGAQSWAGGVKRSSSAGGGGAAGGGKAGGVGWNNVAMNVKPERAPEEDKYGLLKLPRDGLETVAKEINFVNSSQTHLIEEGRLRPSYVPASEHERSTNTFPSEKAVSPSRQEDKKTGVGAGGLSRQDQPWFARNIVDHRSAWCSLRDAGSRAGLRTIRWGDGNPSGGGRLEKESAVLELMSEATQVYLKRVLAHLVTVAWQRRGGLSEDLLRGLEERIEDPRLPPPAVELREGLVPRILNDGEAGDGSATASAAADPRELLRRDEETHRRTCLTREAGWEADVAETMAAADAERKLQSRRRSFKNEPPQRVGVEALAISSASGWLSREQIAANEFARRVGASKGVGLSLAAAAEWRRRQRSAAATAAAPAEAEATEAKAESGGRDGAGGGEVGQQLDQMEVVGAGGASSTLGRKADGEGSDRSSDDNDGKPASGRNKRALTEDDEDACRIVRDVRRRFKNGGGGSGDEHQSPKPLLEGTAYVGGSSTVPAVETGGRPARTEINTTDLLEYLRVARPKCGRASWVLLSAMKPRIASMKRRRAAAAAEIRG